MHSPDMVEIAAAMAHLEELLMPFLPHDLHRVGHVDVEQLAWLGGFHLNLSPAVLQLALRPLPANSAKRGSWRGMAPGRSARRVSRRASRLRSFRRAP